MVALQRQRAEGGSWLVRVSLAQTGHWLWKLGRLGPDGLAATTPAFEDITDVLDASPSGFGPMTAVQNNNFNLTVMSYGIGIGPGLFPINDPFNGQCNWWGSPDGPGPVGPGSGARVSPDVAYSPWT